MKYIFLYIFKYYNYKFTNIFTIFKSIDINLCYSLQMKIN